MPPAPDLGTLAKRAVALVAGSDRAILGITGPPGSGKSTLAEALLDACTALPAQRLGSHEVASVPMDGFNLADVQLNRLGLRDREGAPETLDDAG